MTTIDEIRATPYGHYFDQVQARFKDKVPPGLAKWWAEKGVYEYMRLRDQLNDDPRGIIRELKQLASEELNG
jgi:hypothetical protein